MLDAAPQRRLAVVLPLEQVVDAVEAAEGHAEQLHGAAPHAHSPRRVDALAGVDGRERDLAREQAGGRVAGDLVVGLVHELRPRAFYEGVDERPGEEVDEVVPQLRHRLFDLWVNNLLLAVLLRDEVVDCLVDFPLRHLAVQRLEFGLAPHRRLPGGEVGVRGRDWVAEVEPGEEEGGDGLEEQDQLAAAEVGRGARNGNHRVSQRVCPHPVGVRSEDLDGVLGHLC
mmetsp:Transcript_12360/g.29859  ORF Transcript_12360/g.29859 Transcript_12360/m.29859 type:complete len:227 (-) Transcript_12360:473-1153(-)